MVSGCLALSWFVSGRFRSLVCIRLFVILLFVVCPCFKTPFYSEFGCFVYFLEVMDWFYRVFGVVLVASTVDGDRIMKLFQIVEISFRFSRLCVLFHLVLGCCGLWVVLGCCL